MASRGDVGGCTARFLSPGGLFGTNQQFTERFQDEPTARVHNNTQPGGGHNNTQPITARVLSTEKLWGIQGETSDNRIPPTARGSNT
ncbi:hypothetical protein EZV62_000382 [Acer yangbiense]|uniref:Uncharacterized protein n=1 Tax=Acer yangbiense TaxID=1000413 RepID=A0A5C7IQZ9_9ROSI|nr:hypothetical protein EZV62_000382 [Acer yangbiense]